MSQYDEGEGGAIEVLSKRVHNVYLDAALLVLIVGVVPYAQDGRIDLCCLERTWGHGAARGRGGGRFQIGDCVIGAPLWYRHLARCGRHAQLGGQGGYRAVVERRVAVVDAGFEVVVPADAEAGEWYVGGGDSEVFGAASEALYDGPAQLEWEGRLDGCTRSASCPCNGPRQRTVWAGDGVAGYVWSAHGCLVRVLVSRIEDRICVVRAGASFISWRAKAAYGALSLMASFS